MMRRRDFLVGAAVVPDGGAPAGTTASLHAMRLRLARRIAEPPMVMLADGTLRMMSTAADERAFRMIDRLIGDDRSS